MNMNVNMNIVSSAVMRVSLIPTGYNAIDE
jgi:hypothetical protein